jgi:hypothetical protein
MSKDQEELVNQLNKALNSRPSTQVPEDILAWREGDPITLDHRKILASIQARSWRLSVVQEMETLNQLQSVSDSFIAENIAVLIAAQSGMSVETFKETFPMIASEHKTLAVQSFLHWDLLK